VRSRYGKVCPTIRSRLFLLLATFSVGLFTVSSAHAATYYVSTNGSDGAAGSQASPFKTIAHAVKRMNAGDTTYVKGGVYSEPPWFGRSGTASAPIKLLNAPGESPVIDCGRVGTKSIVFQNGEYKLHLPIGHITLEGFEIRNCWHGMVMYNGYNITISRNWIHDNAAQGIHGNGRNILVDRNVISHNGAFEGCASGGTHTEYTGKKSTICNKTHGIYTTGPNWVITNNLIYDNLSSGIVVAGYKHCPEGGCYGNKVYTSHEYGGADGWLIANNTIAYQHYRDAIVLWMGLATNSRIINNIFYENSQKESDEINGINFFGSGGNHIVQNNLCYATKTGGTACIGGTTGWQGKIKEESGNIVNTANPNFEGAGATISGVPNFKLKAGSPAIDKGQSLPQVTWDHQGIKRPAGAGFEIGAYEFCPPGVVCEQGSPPPNPTGGGGSFTPGVPVLLSPTGEICPSPYLPLSL